MKAVCLRGRNCAHFEEGGDVDDQFPPYEQHALEERGSLHYTIVGIRSQKQNYERNEIK